MLRSVLPVGAALAVAVAAPSQSFQYPDFSSTTLIARLGNAVQSGNTLQLTANSSNQTGWAWRQTRMPVLNGFEAEFTFRITPPTAGTKAEGMAFVIHDDPNGIAATGGTVWGMGYGAGANSSTGLRRSLAIELDTYQDPFLGDSSANELTVHTRGANGNHEDEQWSLGRFTPATNLSNGQVHSLRVVYVPGQLQLFVDGAATAGLTLAYDLIAGGTYAGGASAPGLGLTGADAIVGFCATTGAGTLTEQVQILSWSWTSAPLLDVCYDGTIGVDTLTVGGSAGGPLRKVELATWQPFSIELANPPAFGPGAPYVLFLSLLPQPGAFGTNLGFGSTCFPVLPTGATELVLVDTIGLFPALLPGAATPFSLALPAGVVTSPLEFTMQAVTFSSLTPLQLGVTNAVDVAFAPAPPPTINSVVPLSAAPGLPISVNGAGFLPGAVLLVNGAPTAQVSSSATAITFAYPAGLACDATVAVVNPDGLGASRPLNPQPVVTNTVLGAGPAAGGASFFVIGTGFAPGTTVTIGGAAANVTTVTTTAVIMTTPPGTPGQQPVVVTTPGGCVAATTYTYQ
ncbi:MAG: IPT/TIG domain-containing protein [Planctomycetes bacterium]|nr:IPT/TIG domain-containing protein [Planctomycetota bacterium]